jgi:hypothetical protein
MLKEPLNKSWTDILPPKYAASALRIIAIARYYEDPRPEGSALGVHLESTILIDNLFGPDLFRGSLSIL